MIATGICRACISRRSRSTDVSSRAKMGLRSSSATRARLAPAGEHLEEVAQVQVAEHGAGVVEHRVARVAGVAGEAHGLVDGHGARASSATSLRSDITWRAVRRRRSKMRTSMLRSAGSRPAGLLREQHAQLLRGVERSPPCGAGSMPKSRTKALAPALSEPDDRPGQDGRRRCSGRAAQRAISSVLLDGERLRRELADDGVQRGDGDEGDDDADDVRARGRPRRRAAARSGSMRWAMRGLADPAEAERRQRDAELRGREVGVEAVRDVERAGARGRRRRGRAARGASGRIFTIANSDATKNALSRTRSSVTRR